MTHRHKKELRSRLRSLRTEHHTLVREYDEVKARVSEYVGRRFLSPGEELECKTLQRLKLHKKDALMRVTRELQDLERMLLEGLEKAS